MPAVKYELAKWSGTTSEWFEIPSMMRGFQVKNCLFKYPEGDGESASQIPGTLLPRGNHP
jgi:hypothetical protein